MNTDLHDRNIILKLHSYSMRDVYLLYASF